MIIHCLYCHQPKTVPVTGRKPKFCSDACKQAHYRLRKNDFQRQRVSSQLKALVLRNDQAFRNANIPFSQPATGTGVYHQVGWTL